MARITGASAGGRKVLAFLDTIAVSEMTQALLDATDDGYDAIVSSTPTHPVLFTSYADHPRKLITLNNLGIKSSAAGRYQILAPTFDDLTLKHHIHGFTPVTQDFLAIMLLKQCGAYPHILVGGVANPIETATALTLAAPIWASLPGAGYHQHENRMLDLLAIYGQKLAMYPDDTFAGIEATVSGQVN